MDFVDADVDVAFTWIKGITDETILKMANRFLGEVAKVKSKEEMVRVTFGLKNTIKTIPPVVMDMVGHMLSRRQHSLFYKIKWTRVDEDTEQDKALGSEDHRRYDAEISATIVPAEYESAAPMEPPQIHGTINKDGVYEVNASLGLQA